MDTLTDSLTESPSRRAPSRRLAVDGASLAYRDFGAAGTQPPLLLLQRFRGTMDDWDPALLDLLATERRVIVFDSRGVGRSDGEPARSIAEQAQIADALLQGLGIAQADVLGWSMGGAAAQWLALERPERVRRLVVAASGPGGVADAPQAPPKVWEVAGKPVNDDADFLYLFFHDSARSQRAGREHLARLATRAEPFSPPASAAAVQAQFEAIMAWARGVDSALARLPQLRQPVLLANGQFDRMIHAYSSYVAGQRLPDAKLVLYPDSGHGFLFQHWRAFGEEVLGFLR